ncbi:MAG TPA: DnaB-like helicase C-terminal domain-containing protein [Gemmatimonadales bacterium]|nr:DnaB-like helicase C-terminal domain-containing protein [Gemmatimonadales bacterium]
MPRPSKRSDRAPDTIEKLVAQIDDRIAGAAPSDTVSTGFPSLDRLLAGGFRRRDLVVLAGDVGSGKSALALGIAIRAAGAGTPTMYLSGEMGPERLMERALALEARVSVDDLRQGRLDDVARAGVGAAALRLRDSPLLIRPLLGTDFEEVSTALDIVPRRQLLVIDSLQLTTPPRPAARLQERVAQAARALKALALAKDLVVLVIAQLPHLEVGRPDPRPVLDDLGALGAIKQNADVILTVYREEMYRPGQGVEGATELILAKNRNGPTGFVDLFFYSRWLRFVDMLDAD